jgi:nucleotide-binding universal stress UspA family protein
MPYEIFVPMDGSGCARRALEHAIGLAKRLGDCTLHVAHAHEQPLLYGEIAVYVPREKMEQLQHEHCEAVLSRADAVLKESGVRYHKEILTGPVAEALAARAHELHCDLVVMGTHGLTSLQSMLMGSIATKLVHLIRIPVTLVK